MRERIVLRMGMRIGRGGNEDKDKGQGICGGYVGMHIKGKGRGRGRIWVRIWVWIWIQIRINRCTNKNKNKYHIKNKNEMERRFTKTKLCTI